MSSSTVATSIIYLGLDVHKDSVTIVGYLWAVMRELDAPPVTATPMAA